MIIKFLGTAANGGVPQWDCRCQNCQRARQNGKHSRTRSSIAVSQDGEKYLLFDTGPDLKFQLWWNGLTPQTKSQTPDKPRESRIEAVFLTHGHGDHTSGLAEFSTGKSFEIPLHAPSDLIEFLFGTESRPSYFGELGRLAKNYVILHAIDEEQSVTYQGIDVTGFEVEHTATDPLTGLKYPSSTYGYEVASDSGKLVYIPDLGEISDKVLERIDGADIFILDATFWWNNELEKTSKIPVTSHDLGHVPVEESIVTLKDADVGKIVYTHINHSNPLNKPTSQQQKMIEENELSLAYDGYSLKL
jgi:pyrroloquinoline quinone biosynthesis protein B